MNDTAINEPGTDVTIDYPHRGDITCRILTIGNKGSVFGNVIAHEIRVAGRFDGTAHATRFLSAPGSKVFGAVYAAEVGIKIGTALHADMRPEFPIQQFYSPALARNVEEAIAAKIPAVSLQPSAAPATPAMAPVVADTVVAAAPEVPVDVVPIAAVEPAVENAADAQIEPLLAEMVVAIAAAAIPVRKTLPPLI